MRLPPRGLTVVELIVGAVALGAVAAVVLPRFGPEQRDARIAKLNAARGAVQSASALIHGAARERLNQPQPPCPSTGFGANPPLVNVAGNGNLCTENGRVQVALLYPAPTLAGVVASAGIVPVPGTPTAGQLEHDGFRAVSVPGGLQLQLHGGADPAACSFTYRQPGALGEAPTISAARTDGC
jgi:MSHA pilin protein MshA